MFRAPLELNSIIRKIKVIADNPNNVFKPSTNNEQHPSAVDITSQLVGMVFGTHIPLPPVEQPLPKAWFATNYGKDVRKAISDINEGVMIDISKAYSAAADIFEVRYNICYNKNLSVAKLFALINTMNEFEGGSIDSSVIPTAIDSPVASLFNSLNAEINSKKIRVGGE